MIDIFHAPEYSTRLVNMPFLKSSLCASLRSSRLLPLCSHVRLYVCHRPCSAGSSGAGSSSCSMQLLSCKKASSASVRTEAACWSMAICRCQ